MDFNELNQALQTWADERGLNEEKGKPDVQYTKILEEIGELSTALNKHWREELLDAIGDVQVTILIYAYQTGIKLKDLNVITTTYPKDPHKLLRELISELARFNELENLAKLSDNEEISTALFERKDVLVCCLEIVADFAQANGTNSLTCLNKAYNTIANRKGKTVNGTFIKEEDLERA